MGEGADAQLYDGLERPYWMGRYPVTNAQFDEFLGAEGYRQKQYWAEAAASGFWTEDGFAVEFERHPLNGKAPDEFVKELSDEEPRTAPHDHGEPYRLPNHPVVGVTWYECLAFTRWLTDHLHGSGTMPEDWIVRLPSEAEWEKAARGGRELPRPPLILAPQQAAARQRRETPQLGRNPRPRRAYPWGRSAKSDKADPNRASEFKTRIQSTSCVGCFPSGASPHGCEAMSGNVWEWTRSLYGDLPYPTDEEERTQRERPNAPPNRPRVLRGGAFYNSPGYVRCAYRNRYFPDGRFSYFGFRLLLSPF